MFVSFFPRPKLFFISAIVWTALAMTIWYSFAAEWFGSSAPGVVGVEMFWTARSLWFDAYFVLSVVIFTAFWMWFAPHSWAPWSILGSSLILFATYFQVQVNVAINAWFGPFYDLVQAALSKARPVTLGEFYGHISTFASIAVVAVIAGVMTRFFVSHYIFRWRTAMNEFYITNWSRLRTIEGASQRVQEDTMRFASTMESLAVELISASMTLLAFLPVLMKLSSAVTELPLVGSIPYPLVIAAVLWSVFGTGLLALIGIKLPGIEFFNQRVEAAYRKELVIGEDDQTRADPPTLHDLFGNIRRNYFRLYLNFLYFNIGRIVYLQIDAVFAYILLGPTIISGTITLGTMNQIIRAFGQVRTSFQYLITSWSTIVDLISIYNRLRAFEATLHGKPMLSLESVADPAGL